MTSLPLLPLARPVLDEREVAAARRAILSGWITQGPEVERFEHAFASFVGAPHAIACSSGTAALHLALVAAGVGSGDEVVTASHSFIATASAVRYCGAIPVFADIDPATYNIDPARIEEAITPRARALLCVHQLGMPCDLAAVVAIGHRHRLPVIEDAACAAGSEILWQGEWQRIGRPHGDLACFSFHPRKVITTGDGGMVTTRNTGWAERIRRLRSHGMDIPAFARHTSPRFLTESYAELGYNYRLTDIQAAIGRVQIERLPRIVAARRELAARYQEILATARGIGLPFEPEWARSNWQTYAIRLPAGADQRQVCQQLLERGISCRPGVMCAHREPAFPRASWRCAGGASCETSGRPCPHLVESERARDGVVQIPLWPQMTAKQQRRVATALVEAVSTDAGLATASTA